MERQQLHNCCPDSDFCEAILASSFVSLPSWVTPFVGSERRTPGTWRNQVQDDVILRQSMSRPGCRGDVFRVSDTGFRCETRRCFWTLATLVFSHIRRWGFLLPSRKPFSMSHHFLECSFLVFLGCFWVESKEPSWVRHGLV